MTHQQELSPNPFSCKQPQSQSILTLNVQKVGKKAGPNAPSQPLTMTTPEQQPHVSLSNAPSCKTLTSKLVTSKQQKFSSPPQNSEPLTDARKKQMSMLTILNKSVKNSKKTKEDPAAV